MNKIKASIANGKITIEIPMENPELAGRGSSNLVIASSHGIQKTELKVNGEAVSMNFYAFIPVDREAFLAFQKEERKAAKAAAREAKEEPTKKESKPKPKGKTAKKAKVTKKTKSKTGKPTKLKMPARSTDGEESKASSPTK